MTKHLAAEHDSPVPPLQGVPEEAWRRIIGRGGNSSDLARILKELGRIWSLPPTNPKSFDEFLIRKGVNVKQQSPSADEQAGYRAMFEKEWEVIVNRTGVLVDAIAQGQLAPELFRGISSFSAQLKEVAYFRGLRSASSENRVLILCALSQEPPFLIQNAMAGMPNSPLMETFKVYENNAASALALKTQGITGLLGRNEEIVDHLFTLVSLAPQNQHQEITALSVKTKENLLDLARVLIKKAPKEGFGKFIRLRLSVFVCLAEPTSEMAQTAKDLLKATADPKVADVLFLMGGDEELKSAFEELPLSPQKPPAAYAARVVDLLRKNRYSMPASYIEKLEHWARAKAPLLVVAAQAQLLALDKISARKFEGTFLKAVRSEKTNSVAIWLTQSPEFSKEFHLEQLPEKVWKLLLVASATSDPQFAIRLIDAKLKTPEAIHYWQQSLSVLVIADSSAANLIFWDVVKRDLSNGDMPEKEKILGREPMRTAILKGFWMHVSTYDDSARATLFSAIQSHLSTSELLSFVQAGLRTSSSTGGSTSRDWVIATLIPTLLGRESIPSDFGRHLPDSQTKRDIAERLAIGVVNGWIFLRQFPSQWHLAALAAKADVAKRVQTGLDIATQNTTTDFALRANMDRLSIEIRAWSERAAPLLDSGFDAVTSLEPPRQCEPDTHALDEVFRQPYHAHKLALFAGKNEWALSYLFGDGGPWPNPDIIFEQICKSFIFIYKLRENASQQMERLKETVLIDLSIAIRSILADIEADLAGYFAFRDVLSEMGITRVAPALGEVLRAVNTEEHRIIREQGRAGRPRIFSMGVKIGSKIVDTAVINKSGVKDDSD